MTMYVKACEFLHDTLARGPRRCAEVIAAAERAGINYGAVLLAARTVVHGDEFWQLRPAVAPSSSRSAELAGELVPQVARVAIPYPALRGHLTSAPLAFSISAGRHLAEFACFRGTPYQKTCRTLELGVPVRVDGQVRNSRDRRVGLGSLWRKKPEALAFSSVSMRVPICSNVLGVA